MPYQRPLLNRILERLQEPRRFIQMLAGPRQVGKTTLARQVLDRIEMPTLYASADGPLLEELVWLEQQWQLARLRAREDGEAGAVLVLDEIHKITGWSEAVKRLWDEDSAQGVPLRVLLLGSSPLMVHQGLSESLAGRFEVSHAGHWAFSEMRDAFGWDVETYVFHGGYPAAAALIGDPERFKRYILDSLIEPVIARDLLLMIRIEKPALLRRLLRLGCECSGQILSFQKMLGQLTDAGNTTTLAYYLELLESAGMLAGLPKYSGRPARRRASSPKLQILNTALMAATFPGSFDTTLRSPSTWGRFVESAVGAHLLNASRGTELEVFYWRDRNREVDFVLKQDDRLAAIEVKSGRRRDALPSLAAFAKAHQPGFVWLVGEGGIALEEFLASPITTWLGL